MIFTSGNTTVTKVDELTYVVTYARSKLTWTVGRQDDGAIPVLQILPSGDVIIKYDQREDFSLFAEVKINKYTGPAYSYKDYRDRYHRDQGPAHTELIDGENYINYYYKHGRLVLEAGQTVKNGKYEIDHITGKKKFNIAKKKKSSSHIFPELFSF